MTEFEENAENGIPTSPETVSQDETLTKEESEQKTFPENVVENEIVKSKPTRVEKKQKPLPIEDFDWEDTGKKAYYKKEELERLQQLYGETFSTVAEQEVVEGTIVAMNPREVVVNIGFKSDAVIPLSEFRYNPDLKVGDKVEVYVENQEDSTGQLILSHKKARLLRAWERVNQAYDNQEIIKGYVKCRTKGGLIVDVFGIEAFLPGSQIDVKPIRDYDIFVDKVMEFKVVKINQEYKNVVVSHKALIEDELEAQKAEIISKLEKGQILEGTVKNITTYGVFIDLGGVDGLIHITDLSWGRINHPEEVVQLDEKIKVVILDFDDNKKRIALGLKQLTPHPWDSLDPNLKVGDKVKGKVVVIADYGAFIEIAPGVEGLIHVSEMSWSQHLRTAHDFMKVGDEVEAVILSLDREQRKMSLGIKQLIPDPWINIKEKYPINSRHVATVRNFTNFGIFVELEEGVDGLIHISDLSWSKKIKHPAEFTKIGEQIEVVVLDVDVESRRLSLGHKQLEENPWDVFETIFTPGSVHRGTIIERADKGYMVSLPYGVEAYLPSRQAIKENQEEAKLDETLDVKVTEFSKENKRIVVSHSKIYQDAQAAEKAKEAKETEKTPKAPKSTKASLKKIKENLEKNTLGDIEALANLKEEMIEEEKAKLETLSKRKKSKKSKKPELDETPELSPEQKIQTEIFEQSSAQPEDITSLKIVDNPSIELPNEAINETQSRQELTSNTEATANEQITENIDKEKEDYNSSESTDEIPGKN
ncbi:MAG: 30S ribosomal protein S1 [Bacteroidetes bacterium 38_7]|nr:MAG: 30S ribosomal protein S1 [Bacteroidetes bacterium 38_7]HAL65663.1 30S ribosomal protein S1 [Bacteroidales bacterium]